MRMQRVGRSIPRSYRWTRWVAAASLGLFYRRIDRVLGGGGGDVAGRGEEPLPSGPVVLAANHPNYIIDALAIATQTERQVQFVAKGPLVDRYPVLSPFLRRLGVIPVYREEDRRAGGARQGAGDRPLDNRESFAHCADVLEAGGVVCMFAEGRSHAAPQVRELRTGTARIVLEAEARSGYRLGVQLIPVGLYFPQEDRFFSDGVVVFGEALALGPFLAQHRTDPSGAVRSLTAALQASLRGLALHVPDAGWTTFVDQMYDLMRWGDEDAAWSQLRVRQSIAGGIERYRSEQPENAAEFRRRVSRLWRRSEAWRRHRLPERDAAARGRGAVWRLRDALALPWATLGFLYHAPPYLVPKLWARWLVPSREKKAFVKFLVGAPTFVGWYAATLWWLARRRGRAGWALGLAVSWLVAGPLSGLLALRMRAHRLRWLDAFRGLSAEADVRVGAAIASERAELLEEFGSWIGVEGPREAEGREAEVE